MGSYSKTAFSRRSTYSVVIAVYYNKLSGELKYTGTVIFEISFPMLSLIIVQRLILILGSLKNGS